jgi:hypothetical protein
MNGTTTSILLLLTLGICACGDNQEPEQADALWDRIHAENYRGFERAPGYDARTPSNTAHSDAVDIYVNSVVSEALMGEAIANWPVGSLIVKDGWDGDTLDLVAVMDKRAAGWFYAEYTDVEDGDALYSGKPDLCVDCHSSGEDFVRAFRLPL